jgi:hypothetical protein
MGYLPRSNNQNPDWRIIPDLALTQDLSRRSRREDAPHDTVFLVGAGPTSSTPMGTLFEASF